jgi:phosphoglycerate dehydrogenase-like enzyme
MSNVVVTPHVAGTTLDTWSRRLQFAYDNVQRVAAGEPALSLIGPTP